MAGPVIDLRGNTIIADAFDPNIESATAETVTVDDAAFDAVTGNDAQAAFASADGLINGVKTDVDNILVGGANITGATVTITGAMTVRQALQEILDVLDV
jgi:hypothetical protein